MGIVRQLVQIAVVEAVRGKTLAGNSVYDSRIDALPAILQDGKRPFLVFSIETGRQPKGDEGLLGRDNRFTLMVHAAVATASEIAGEDGSIAIANIGETDAALEAVLNIMDRQWRAALSDGGSPWGNLFLEIVRDVEEVQDYRGTDPDTGRKHASRLTEVSLTVMAEPELGCGIVPTIETGLALLEADGDAAYAEIARVWREVLTDEDDLSDHVKLGAKLFQARDALLALGHEDPETAPFPDQLHLVIDGETYE